MFFKSASQKNSESEFVGANLFKSKESAKKYLFDLITNDQTPISSNSSILNNTIIWIGLTCMSLGAVLNFFPGVL